jgi:hypothetical protein
MENYPEQKNLEPWGQLTWIGDNRWHFPYHFEQNYLT